MTHKADVYAGDLDAAGQGIDTPKGESYVFRVLADATPDVFSRIANQFNVANVPPRRVMLRTDMQGRIEIEIVLAGISASVADRIARKLDQQLMVMRVDIERRS